MKLKRIIVSLLLMVLVFGNIGVSYATSLPNREIGLLWEDAGNIYTNLKNYGNSIRVEASILAKSNSDFISGTMYLERYSNGRWVSDKTWSFSGTGSKNLSKSYTGISGNTYRVRVNAKIGGQSISETSSSIRL